MAVISPLPYFQFLDDDGTPLDGGFVYTYESGTTTPLSTYTTAVGDVAHANPIELDSEGRASIFLIDGDEYTFVVKRANLTTVRTVDGIQAPQSPIDLDDYVNVTTAQPVAGIKTFSSSPIIPTPSPGDSTGKAAPTAFVTAAIAALSDVYVSDADFTGAHQDLDTAGFQELPGGLILNWGSFSLGSSVGATQTVTFGKAFTTTFIGGWASPSNAATQQIGVDSDGSPPSLTQMTLEKGDGDVTARTGMWFAIGK